MNSLQTTSGHKASRRPVLRGSNVLYLSAIALALTVGTAWVTGCGGGGGSSAVSDSAATRSGRATLTITWPATTAAATSRLIPVASSTITVKFLQNGTVVSSQTVSRPTTGDTSTVTFTNLPLGALTVQADAYPNPDGSGIIQATGSGTVNIVADQVAPLALTLGSTISSVSVTPASPTAVIGQTTQLALAAVDSSGNIVLTAPSKITWSSASTSVATVDANGLVTGVAAGTSQITVTETESGKSAIVTVTVSTTSPSPSPSSSSSPSTGTSIVDLANAYINTLSDTQKTATVVTSSATNAAKWSNLPANPSGSTGTTSLRNGVAYSTLSTAQKAAWNALVQAALGANGSNAYNQMTQVRNADYYLGTLNSGYSGDYEYVAFVGTPSTSGTWMLQVGGHHNAHNYYYTGTTMNTTTPYHIAVEPTSFTYNGASYTPLSAQSTAMTNLLKSFTTAQLSSAKLSGSFSDIYLGPGKDARSNFPTSGRGMLASNLTDAQKALLKTAIAAWVQNSPLASTYQSQYESELDATYVGYAGNSSAPGTVFSAQGDYLRIDGPHVWIEFACQGGIVIQGQIHYHTIWRDRVTDYNAAYGF